MRIVVKSIALFTMIAVLIAMWLPNFVFGPTASADDNTTGSTIGNVEIGNLKGDELVNALTVAVQAWYAQPITVSGGGSAVQVSNETFEFDIAATVAAYEANYAKKWYEFWASESTVHLPLIIQPSDIVKNEISNVSSWNTEQTYEKVEMNASYLKVDEVEAVVVDFSALEAERISLSVEPMPEAAMGINELVIALNDTVIESNGTFSMITSLGDSINLANREAINFVASNIYNAALNSNGEILERHSQNKLQSYLKPGLEAKVDAFSMQDLQFLNTALNPIKLKLTMEGENLKTEVYSTNKESEVLVTVSNDEVIKPRTITRYSANLAIGQTQQLQAGEDGLRVSVYRTVLGEQKLISRDYYSPVNRVLLKSSKQPVVTPTSPSSSSVTDEDLQIDLDGDGLPDVDLTEEGSSNPQQAGSGDSIDSEGSELPPGSYYDKGGNIKTP